ncbi:MAG: hypothetical protein ACR2G0_03185 [Chthoniobacterales bacterium]
MAQVCERAIVMMHGFLVSSRTDLVERCRVKGARRPARGTSDKELNFGISYFLDQLIETLQLEETSAEGH